MEFNLNGTADIPKLIEKIWSSIWGVFIAWLIEIIAVIYFNHSYDICPWPYICVFLIGLLPATFLIWAIATKRWFQRSTYWTLFTYLGVIVVCVAFFYLVYPLWIKDTQFDLAYIQLWGAFLLWLILSFGCYYYFRYVGKRNNLYIVFLVSNRSTHERDIKKSLEEARCRIEELDSKIQIIIPPFGIANSIRAAERYINGHFNQADAVIFAGMIDSAAGSKFGYQFTKFTSRFSNRYIKTSQSMKHDVDYLMTQSYKCHEWNTLNIKKDNISQTLQVAGNLQDLFLMYVSCIYLYKNKYTDAIDIVDQLYALEGTGNVGFDNLVKELRSHAYLIAEQNEEHENRDFVRAHEILNECVAKIPSMKRSLAYNLALSRLYYYEGNIKESKKVTRNVKNTIPHTDWYWTINMAFYAIRECKPKEVYTHYKRLTKITPPGKVEVEFPLRFQEKELKETSDDLYKMFLLHGIAFLSLYSDEKVTDKMLKAAEHYKKISGYSDLQKLRELIGNCRGKLLYKEKKQKDI